MASQTRTGSVHFVDKGLGIPRSLQLSHCHIENQEGSKNVVDSNHLGRRRLNQEWEHPSQMYVHASLSNGGVSGCCPETQVRQTNVILFHQYPNKSFCQIVYEIPIIVHNLMIGILKLKWTAPYLGLRASTSRPCLVFANL